MWLIDAMQLLRRGRGCGSTIDTTTAATAAIPSAEVSSSRGRCRTEEAPHRARGGEVPLLRLLTLLPLLAPPAVPSRLQQFHFCVVHQDLNLLQHLPSACH